MFKGVGKKGPALYAVPSAPQAPAEGAGDAQLVRSRSCEASGDGALSPLRGLKVA
ncbi:hypothetical protein LHA01_24890 [Schleiferilactobacillus harbinensis]|jgi:hypothetical protein|nr:hypothetical protein LHA01_24890 [Schleiferilactobacillus harbinensis]